MTPTPTRRIAGQTFKVDEHGRTVIPPLAGADDDAAEAAAAAEKEKADKDAADAKAAADKAEADKAAADKAAAEKEKGLTPADRAALEAVVQKERAATKTAEKAAREAQAKLDKIEADSLSETEKLKKQAEDGAKAAVTATTKLRQANLITALADKGLAGGKAKAAARLLDGVEYDDEDEPTNLDVALDAAKASYGEDMFAAGEPTKPKPGGTANGGDGGNDAKVELTADELEAAKATGTTPERYAAMKGVSTLADFTAAEKRLSAAEK